MKKKFYLNATYVRYLSFLRYSKSTQYTFLRFSPADQDPNVVRIGS